MSTVAAYTHVNEREHIAIPDPRPGSYYVSAIDGDRHTFLLGPYATHAEALAHVADGRRLALWVDSKAHWYAYGTARATDYSKPGVLNDLLEGEAT